MGLFNRKARVAAEPPVDWGSGGAPADPQEFGARTYIRSVSQHDADEFAVGVEEFKQLRAIAGGDGIPANAALLAWGPGWFQFTDGREPMRAYITKSHACFLWYRRNSVVVRPHRFIGLSVLEPEGWRRLNWTDTLTPLNVQEQFGDDPRENRRAYEWMGTLLPLLADAAARNPVVVEGFARRQPLTVPMATDPGFGDGAMFGRRDGTLHFVSSAGVHTEIRAKSVTGWKRQTDRITISAAEGMAQFYVPATSEWSAFVRQHWREG